MNNNKAISFLAVSFRQGFVSPNLPLASFYQGNKKITFLLDTGSDSNIIDKKAVEQFIHNKHEESSINRVTGIGGEEDVTVCTISFSCDDGKYTTDFLITDLKVLRDIEKEHGIPIHGILGSNFLRQYNIILDFNNLVAHNNHDLPCNQPTATVQRPPLFPDDSRTVSQGDAVLGNYSA